MNTQETLNNTASTNVPVRKLVVDPKKRKNELLESIAEDCLVDSKVFVEQSKAPEGE